MLKTFDADGDGLVSAKEFRCRIRGGAARRRVRHSQERAGGSGRRKAARARRRRGSLWDSAAVDRPARPLGRTLSVACVALWML